MTIKLIVEYAGSSSSECNYCKIKIKLGLVKIAEIVEVIFLKFILFIKKTFSGKLSKLKLFQLNANQKIYLWHHYDCFFKCNKNINEDCLPEIENLEMMKWFDLNEIKRLASQQRFIIKFVIKS